MLKVACKCSVKTLLLQFWGNRDFFERAESQSEFTLYLSKYVHWRCQVANGNDWPGFLPPPYFHLITGSAAILKRALRRHPRLRPVFASVN